MGEPVTKDAAAWKVRAVAAEAEVERLRSLPTIETCRMCAHCEVGPARPAPRTPWLPGEKRRLVDFCNAKDWRRTVDRGGRRPSLVVPVARVRWPMTGTDRAASRAGRAAARLLRARLALYLRAVLRAEAGEEWRGYVSWSPRWREEFRTERWPTSDCYERVRLAVPLWSQAPGRKT